MESPPDGNGAVHGPGSTGMTSTTSRPAEITVLHVRDCPSVAPLLDRLSVAADLAGVSITTTLRLVRSEAEANEIAFAGSPTLLIDGCDPFPSEGVTSFGCRLYGFDGHLDGAPSMSQLTAALLVASTSRNGIDPA
ncbi:MAG: hypothetical protein AB7V74_10830 [Acidimicrobiia bacterium]